MVWANKSSKPWSFEDFAMDLLFVSKRMWECRQITTSHFLGSSHSFCTLSSLNFSQKKGDTVGGEFAELRCIVLLSMYCSIIPDLGLGFYLFLHKKYLYYVRYPSPTHFLVQFLFLFWNKLPNKMVLGMEYSRLKRA